MTTTEMTANAPDTTPVASVPLTPAASEAPAPAEGNQPPGSTETETPSDEQPKKSKVRFTERISELVASKKQFEAMAVSARAERDRALAEADRLRRINRDEVDPSMHNRLDLHEALQTQRAIDDDAKVKAAEDEAKKARAAVFFNKVDEARASIPDIDDALSEFLNLPFGDVVADVIADSDMAAELAHHLGRNRVLASEILRMAPHMQARALTQLEAKLSKASVSRKTSKAPAPVQTVGGVASMSSKPMAEMSMDEYVAARKAGKV